MPRIINNVAKRFETIKGATVTTKKASDGTATLAALLKMTGANFEKVEPGQGMAFPIPAGVKPTTHLAGFRGKIISVTRVGQPWAGRKYNLKVDTATNEVVIGRDADGEALPAKKGGRPKGSTREAVAAAKAAAQSHLGGSTDGKVNGSAKKDEPTPPAGLAGAALAAWKKKNGGGEVKDLTAQ